MTETTAPPQHEFRGKYGKRDPKQAIALLFGKYDNQAKNPALSFPAVDYLGNVDWSGTMNGNDDEGDCVSCGIVNTALLISTVLSGTGLRASLAEVIVIYKTQNPDFDPNGTEKTNGPGSNADGGMDIQTALEAWVKDGFTIGGQLIKAVGFAKIDHTNLQEIKNAISVFGVVILGVQVTDAQQQQFPGVWDYVAGSPVEGGHCIIAGGHIDVTSDDVKGECWASEFGTTDEFLAKQLDEAWAVILPWHLESKEFIDGMDLATFASDYTAITGDQFPVAVAPDPAPAPEPVPAPVPDPSPEPAPSPQPDPEPDPEPDPVPVDPPAPPVPVVPVPTVNDPTINGTNVTLTGTGTVGDDVVIYNEDGTLFGAVAPIDANGAWTATAALTVGSHTLTAVQRDSAGDASDGVQVPVTIADAPPTPTPEPTPPSPPIPTPPPTPPVTPTPPAPDDATKLFAQQLKRWLEKSSLLNMPRDGRFKIEAAKWLEAENLMHIAALPENEA